LHFFTAALHSGSAIQPFPVGGLPAISLYDFCHVSCLLPLKTRGAMDYYSEHTVVFHRKCIVVSE